jgi:hypothetical protein
MDDRQREVWGECVLKATECPSDARVPVPVDLVMAVDEILEGRIDDGPGGFLSGLAWGVAIGWATMAALWYVLK